MAAPGDSFQEEDWDIDDSLLEVIVTEKPSSPFSVTPVTRLANHLTTGYRRVTSDEIRRYIGVQINSKEVRTHHGGP